MAKHILIILGHPDPHPERFHRTLAEAYHAAAAESLLGMVEARDNATRTRCLARLTELGRHGA